MSIVVPSWNGWWLLEKNLPSLLAAVREVGSGEVVVADDASEDLTASKLEGYSRELRVVQLGKRSGFAGAANHGVQAAQGEYIFLVNNDVVVPTGVVGALLESLRDPKVFAVVPGIVRSSTGVDESWTRIHFRRGMVTTSLGTDPQEPDFACGAAMCFRRREFLSLGGFDALFAPFYWEDVDVSYRARKRGFLVQRARDVSVYHEHSQTIGTLPDRSRVQRVYERNRLFFIWKNITEQRLWRKHLAWLPAKLAFDVFIYRDFVYGLLDALRSWSEVARRRWREKRQAVREDSELLRLGRKTGRALPEL